LSQWLKSNDTKNDHQGENDSKGSTEVEMNIEFLI